jgi:hypothetical protein
MVGIWMKMARLLSLGYINDNSFFIATKKRQIVEIIMLLSRAAGSRPSTAGRDACRYEIVDKTSILNLDFKAKRPKDDGNSGIRA